jgi:hypothetical protein
MYDKYDTNFNNLCMTNYDNFSSFESPNRLDSKYDVLKNVCIDFLTKTCEKPIHIRTILKSGFHALNS